MLHTVLAEMKERDLKTWKNSLLRHPLQDGQGVETGLNVRAESTEFRGNR